MISRIENIDDLITWLGCIVNLETKNKDFAVLNLTVDQISDFAGVQDTLSKLKSKLSGSFKQCCRCKSIWPETKEWFDWSGQGRTGLHSICKFCRNSYQKEHKKTQRAIKNNYGYSCPADLEEANRHHVLEIKKPSATQSPKPGEAW